MAGTHTYLREHTLQARKIVLPLEQELERLRPLLRERERAGVALLKEHALNVVLTVLREGVQLSEHEPRGAATVHVLEGRIRVEMDGQSEVVETGSIVALDANVRREVVALADCVLLTTVALESGEQETTPQ